MLQTEENDAEAKGVSKESNVPNALRPMTPVESISGLHSTKAQDAPS